MGNDSERDERPIAEDAGRSYALEITADELGTITCVKVDGLEFVPADRDLARQELRALAGVAASHCMGYPALTDAVNRAGDFLGMKRRDPQ